MTRPALGLPLNLRNLMRPAIVAFGLSVLVASTTAAVPQPTISEPVPLPADPLEEQVIDVSQELPSWLPPEPPASDVASSGLTVVDAVRIPGVLDESTNVPAAASRVAAEAKGLLADDLTSRVCAGESIRSLTGNCALLQYLSDDVTRPSEEGKKPTGNDDVLNTVGQAVKVMLGERGYAVDVRLNVDGGTVDVVADDAAAEGAMSLTAGCGLPIRILVDDAVAELETAKALLHEGFGIPLNGGHARGEDLRGGITILPAADRATIVVSVPIGHVLSVRQLRSIESVAKAYPGVVRLQEREPPWVRACAMEYDNQIGQNVRRCNQPPRSPV